MNSPGKRVYLQHLVQGKNEAFRPLTDDERALGFLGWHERGYLPHCDYPGLTQLITFRLADSMPAARRGEWEHLLSIEDTTEKRTKLEEYLDCGVGTCALRDADIAQRMEGALQHFHGDRYELLAWVVMPNHVHVLVQIWMMPMSKLVRSWKRHIAGAPQSLRRETEDDTVAPQGLRRSFWEREYWDTHMRDEEQERKAIRYIENNPVKARLCLDPAAFPWSSARHRNPQPGH